MKFVQKQASCNLLLFVLWDFLKCVITVQPTNNIKCIEVFSAAFETTVGQEKPLGEVQCLSHHGRKLCGDQ